MSTIQLSLTQCRQIAAVADLRETLDRLNDQPRWLPEAIDDLSTVFAVIQGGCESGAYMPAVTYYTASQTMGEHGDDIIDYLDDAYGFEGVPQLERDDSWRSYCCKVLSAAVSNWCLQFVELYDADVDWD